MHEVMMHFSLGDLPFDVIEKVAKHSYAPEAIRLSTICRSFAHVRHVPFCESVRFLGKEVMCFQDMIDTICEGIETAEPNKGMKCSSYQSGMVAKDVRLKLYRYQWGTNSYKYIAQIVNRNDWELLYIESPLDDDDTDIQIRSCNLDVLKDHVPVLLIYLGILAVAQLNNISNVALSIEWDCVRLQKKGTSWLRKLIQQRYTGMLINDLIKRCI